jgi:hypothetical protein
MLNITQGKPTHWRLPRQPQIAEPTSSRATTINIPVITYSLRDRSAAINGVPAGLLLFPPGTASQ